MMEDIYKDLIFEIIDIHKSFLTKGEITFGFINDLHFTFINLSRGRLPHSILERLKRQERETKKGQKN